MNKLSWNTLDKQDDLVGWLVKVISGISHSYWYKVITKQDALGDIFGSFGMTEEEAIEAYQVNGKVSWAMGSDSRPDAPSKYINKINKYTIIPIKKIF